MKTARVTAPAVADVETQLRAFIGIRLESAAVLARPEVKALVAAAVARAKTPLRATGRGKLIIRSVSAKQRPRRGSAK
jgi:hypothetical protein